jgi:hypothetical protein
MPSSAAILSGVTTIANQWRTLAIGWHMALGTLLLVLLIGRRPSNRLAGYLLVSPFLSVSYLAWTSGNPFNGVMFAALALMLIGLASRLSSESVHIASSLFFVPGALLLTFGWGYPHFLEGAQWTTYAYAAPLGLLPCPTLSAVIGLTLIFSRLGSTSWTMTLAAVGLVYGAIGVFRLGIALDYVLLAGAIVLVGAVPYSSSRTSVGPMGQKPRVA